MSYSANQYNYCTPLSGAASFTDASVVVDDAKYFTLFDNVLDGSYRPITGNVGLWGTSLSNEAGILASPFVLTVEETLSISAISLVGSSYAYPVAFTIQFYNGDTLLHTLTETENNSPAYMGVLPDTYDITKYVITVTQISAPNSVLKLYKSYQAFYIQTYDTLPVAQNAAKRLTVTVSGAEAPRISLGEARKLTNLATSADSVVLKPTEKTSIRNTINKTSDVLPVKYGRSLKFTNIIGNARDSLRVAGTEDTSYILNTIESASTLVPCSFESSVPTNIHAAMKRPTRHIYGKVYITYTDPMLNDTISDIEVSSEAYNSNTLQLTDGLKDSNGLFFTLYDNDLSGRYSPSSDNTQVGWTSGNLSNADGIFDEAPYVVLNFATRPIAQLVVCFDDSRGNLVKDFVVDFISSKGTTTSFSFVDNTLPEVTMPIESALIDIVSIKITISKVAKPYSPATILDIPALSTFLYTGYQNESSLISIDLLEELTYEDEVEALGGVSANEITIVLDNSTKMFNINNPLSPVAGQLRRNRKIVPWLGAEVTPGDIEWHQLGVFWSYTWDVPVGSLTASVVGFDTLGLIDKTPFTNHQTLIDKSLGELIEYVLVDAKQFLDFLEWSIADELYEVIIPYAWFANSSHAAALRKISVAYPMHIYCDRQGRVVAAPQKLRLDYYKDIWADNTNVIDKTYSSLYTVLPNIVNVTVVSPTLKAGENLVRDTLIFDIKDVPSRTLQFNAPYVSDITLSIDKDSSVSYTYKVYSWGIEINFTGSGTVRSIECVGTSLDTSNTAILSRRDETSIQTNGAVTRDISADFIQTSSLANYIMDRLASLSENDKYDVEVTYRGDISLTINDPILLNDSIAPDNRYNIKRHQLTWDGSLTGSAHLNT